MRIMKLLAVLFLFSASLQAATWYAAAGSANINAASEWKATSGGSCSASGTTLTWGNQLDGDVFDANGCTAIAVNVDPGSVSVHVTLQTNATNGGGFTYAMAANIGTLHAHIIAGTTVCLNISGNANGLTIVGNIQGGTASGAYGIQGSFTVVTLTIVGNITGGSAGTCYGLAITTSGAYAITGNVTAGTGAHGLNLNAGGLASTLTGNCVGSDTANFVGCSWYSTSTIQLTVTGNLINGLKGGAATGAIAFTPGPTNYMLFAKDSSYVLGVIDSHATKLTTGTGLYYTGTVQ